MTRSPVVLFDDLIYEVLPFLPVKSLLRFRCVSKSWKTLISDPFFVKLHLEKSQSQKLNSSLFTIFTGFTLFTGKEHLNDDELEEEYSVVRYPIDRIFENPSFTCFHDSHSHHLNIKEFRKGSFIVGSCNGLILLADADLKHWLRVWNPATRTLSENFGYSDQDFLYAFVCDNSTGTYKVVAYCNDGETTSEVRVLNLGDDVWRNIDSFPCALDLGGYHAYLSGTLNWLAIYNIHSMVDLWDNFENIAIQPYIIVSLDLETETYREYKVPLGFAAEVPPNRPVIAVLRSCLCFSYANKETDFVIWQMKEFGVQDSWTQLLKVSYHDLLIDCGNFSDDGGTMFCFQLEPLFLSEDGDTLILNSNREAETILYNRRDNRTKRTKIIASRTIGNNRTSRYYDDDDDDVYLVEAKDYVESLVPIF